MDSKKYLELYVRIVFFLMILLSALVILIVQPLSQEIEFGEGKIVNWIEDYLEDTFAMLIRGFTVVVMVLWDYTFTEWVRDVLEFAHDPSRRRGGIAGIINYLQEAIAEREAEPRDDFITELSCKASGVP